MKKAITLISVFILCFSLIGCMSKEDLAIKKEYEKQAKEYMQEYLSENYDNYKIQTIQQDTHTALISAEPSPISIIEVVADGKKITFYYNVDTKNLWSTEYYDEVIKEYIDYIEECEILKEAEIYDISILIYDANEGIDNFKALYCTDKSLEDVFRTMEEDKKIYKIRNTFYFEEKEGINPYDINIDSMFPVFGDIDIVLQNVISLYNEKVNSKENILDKACYSINILKEPISNQYIDVNVYYTHNIKKEVNDLTFLYNDIFYDINIEQCEFTPEEKSEYEYTGLTYRIELNEKEYINKKDKIFKSSDKQYFISNENVGEHVIIVPNKDFPYKSFAITDNSGKIKDFVKKDENISYYDLSFYYQNKENEALFISFYK